MATAACRRSSHQLSHPPPAGPPCCPGPWGAAGRTRQASSRVRLDAAPGAEGPRHSLSCPAPLHGQALGIPAPWQLSRSAQRVHTVVWSPLHGRRASPAGQSCPGAPGPRGGAGSPPRVPTARTPRRQQHPPGGQCSGNRPEKERTGDRRRYKEHLADFRQARTTHEPRAPSGDARRGPGHPPGGGTQRGAPASARAASCLHRSREAIPMRGAGGHREG